MTRPIVSIFSFALMATTGSAVHAQQLPPVRPLGPILSTSASPLGSVSAVRELSGGRVLVNDITRRQVVMFDSTLKTATVVADSTSTTGNAYSGRIGGLIPYHGDSTLFVDPMSMSMLVIDPAGKVGRVMSVPSAAGAIYLIGGPFGTPGFDAEGRLVYRGQARGPAPTTPPSSDPHKFVMPPQPDSAPIVRFDLATRKLDTAAFFKIPKLNATVTQTASGGMTVRTIVNPLPTADDWAILPDGSIAVVRGRDFHIDWINPDKTVVASPKLPFEWQHLSDEAKTALLDSTRAAMEKVRATMTARLSGSGTTSGTTAATSAGASPAAGADRAMVVIRSGDRAGPPAGGAAAGYAAGAAAGVSMPQVDMVPPSELPDYKPAFSTGAVRADADGNVWIRTSKTVAGAPVYDVVNRRGGLIDRVQLPAGSVIAGFGAGGIVYLGVRDAAGARLERARVH